MGMTTDSRRRFGCVIRIRPSEVQIFGRALDFDRGGRVHLALIVASACSHRPVATHEGGYGARRVMRESEMEHGEIAIPKTSEGDWFRALVLGTVGSVPVAGSLVSSIVAELWRGPFERRVDLLFAEFARRIAQLERALSDDDLLRDSVLSAVSIAARDALASDDDKIAYLASALSNVASNPTWTHDEAATLLRLVSQLTASHLRVLELLQDPKEWAARNHVELQGVPDDDGSYRQRDMIADAFAQLDQKVDGLHTILQDLESKGFLNTIGLAEENPQDAAIALLEMTSELGDRIVQFVTWSPEQLN